LLVRQSLNGACNIGDSNWSKLLHFTAWWCGREWWWWCVRSRNAHTSDLRLKVPMNSIAPMSCDGGIRPRPSNNASTEHHSWVGDDRSASTFAVQKASRLRRNRSRYVRRWVIHSAEAAAAPSVSDVRQAARSNRRMCRFASRHSSSNHGSDGRRRDLTVWTGMRQSSAAVISSLYSCTRPSTSNSGHASGRQRVDADRRARKASLSSWRHVYFI